MEILFNFVEFSNCDIVTKTMKTVEIYKNKASNFSKQVTTLMYADISRLDGHSYTYYTQKIHVYTQLGTFDFKNNRSPVKLTLKNA